MQNIARNMQTICRIWNKICKIICRICKKYVQKYANPFWICRIVTSRYSAYFEYHDIYTPHFADAPWPPPAAAPSARGSGPRCRLIPRRPRFSGSGSDRCHQPVRVSLPVRSERRRVYSGLDGQNLSRASHAASMSDASAPASAGGTDWDLAVPQFTQNCWAYNIIEF